MALRWQCICIDCADPPMLGRFWADLLGWRYFEDDDGDVVLEPPAGSPEDGVSPDILFLKVPEPKTVKDRIHIDLRPEDQEAEVARALELGATHIDIGQSAEATWTVLADPEGNEFCILRAYRPEELAEESRSPSG